MSFLFVDRILHMEEGRFIQGIKQVTRSDSYLYCTPVGAALMPAIIGETLGQLGAWCAMQANGFTKRPVAGIVSAVHIHADAYAGDTILLNTYIDALDDAAVEYHSTALVNGNPVFTIESALGPMLPMEDFISKKAVKMQFDRIYRPGSYASLKEPLSSSSFPSLREAQRRSNDGKEENVPHSEDGFSQLEGVASFDRIVSWHPAEEVVAEKAVSLSAPYFADHFPRKPVLPLTILLQAKLSLGSQFLSHSFPDGQYFKPAAVQKVKMNAFVQPGDIVSIRLRLKEKTEDKVILSYHSESENKKVCVAEAVFVKQPAEEEL